MLWESLEATWVAEDGPESKRRPSASVVLDRLEKTVDHWGKSIFPEEWREGGGYLKLSNEFHSLLMTLLQQQVLSEKTIGRRLTVGVI